MSSAKDFMPNVSFIYTEQNMERYQNIKNGRSLANVITSQLVSKWREEPTLADEDEYVSETAAIPGKMLKAL